MLKDRVRPTRRYFRSSGGGGGGGGGGSSPVIALFQDSAGNWFIDDNASATGDGFFVSSDGESFLIDDAVPSGLTLSGSDGNFFVTYP